MFLRHGAVAVSVLHRCPCAVTVNSQEDNGTDDDDEMKALYRKTYPVVAAARLPSESAAD